MWSRFVGRISWRIPLHQQTIIHSSLFFGFAAASSAGSRTPTRHNASTLSRHLSHWWITLTTQREQASTLTVNALPFDEQPREQYGFRGTDCDHR
jgi:hypothetical protein